MPGELTISLKADIMIRKCLKIRGSKTISGGGKYRLRRQVSGGTYKGTLLQMQGNRLTLHDVAINGSGRNTSVSADINGRLIEVDAGTVVLESGAVLHSNYNVSSYTDGGGGITVHRGGKVVMKQGSVIRDNLSITGGSGVRIEKGGMFSMEGGQIANNAVLGQRADTDFDGRGGAIHNRGIVQIQGGVISGNVAKGYTDGSGRHGGYGGAIYNQNHVTITGGRIEKNEGTFAGGALYTNETSVVCVEGGTITQNDSPGQRGGGIYISSGAVVQMSGGQVTENRAKDGSQIFVSSNCTGGLKLQGGTIRGEREAVYINGGRCSVSGGMVRGENYGIKYSDGTLYLSGTPWIDTVFQKEGKVIMSEAKIQMKHPCELCPEVYEEGRELVHIRSGQTPAQVISFFVLRKKKHFILEQGKDGVYIGREKYEIHYEANGGQGNMKSQKIYVGEKVSLPECTFWRAGYGFVGWSKTPGSVRRPSDIPYVDKAAVKNLGTNGERVHLYALWVKRPVLTDSFSHFIFYEGEYVEAQALLHGMHAEDECDGNLTEQIRITGVVLPDGSECNFDGALSTKERHTGKGEVVYQVVNSFGIGSRYRRTYEVLTNQAPEIVAENRYYFVGEYSDCQREEARKDVLSRVQLRDDVEKKGQLVKNMVVQWGELNFQSEGVYPVTIRIRDQYGNRFYMRDGEERQYGSGKGSECRLHVHVVRRENETVFPEKGGYVRFISGETVRTLRPDSVWRSEPYAGELEEAFSKTGSSCEEIWTVSAQDKRKIKAFMREQNQPFSRETNEQFLQKFSYMRKEREIG